jgi:hypothetical protein
MIVGGDKPHRSPCLWIRCDDSSGYVTREIVEGWCCHVFCAIGWKGFSFDVYLGLASVGGTKMMGVLITWLVPTATAVAGYSVRSVVTTLSKPVLYPYGDAAKVDVCRSVVVTV